MKKILRFLKGYEKETVLAPLFKLLEASFELIIPLVVAEMIDQGIGQGNRDYILRMGIVMISLGLIGLVCSVTAQFFSAKAAVGMATGLRRKLFEHIQSFSYTEIDAIGTSTLITRMTSDINQIQSGVNMTLRLFLRSPFIVAGAMVMAFTVDVNCAVIFAVIIPMLAVVVFGIMYITMPLYRKVQQHLDMVLRLARENLTGVRVIRAFHKEEDEIKKFKEGNEKLTSSQLLVGKVSALLNPVTYVLINGALVLLIYMGAFRVDMGVLTQGQVVALINYMSQILVELIKLANLIVLLSKAFACANRVQDLFELESSMADEGNAEIEVKKETPILTFRDVGFAYANAAENSLNHIQFSVYPGETIGIIGGTGSGKSTLVNLIPRFYEATEGEICYHGKPLKEYSLETLRDQIGVVPQKAVLFRGTVRENLLWGNAEASEETLQRALEQSQAKEFVEKLDKGLDFPVAQGGKNLSGGQRQRLTIARALVREPEILILDDSASALDYATDAKLRASIRQMREHLTVFIVSQRTSSIRFADQILVMDDGNIVGMGTHEELLGSCEVYREIYDSQYQTAQEGEDDE
ncbi:MAG: ABC transporter ATP-binding protein [Lachnospiraceae bacterium]